MHWKLLTDFAPPPPGGWSSYSTGSSYSTDSKSAPASTGGGWFLALGFAATIGLGYVLVQIFAPAANEPLGWITFGFGAVGGVLVGLFVLVMLVCGVVSALAAVKRALGRGLVRLGTWMAG